MASGVNKAILLGRLGRDPEARQTGAGQAVASLSVATGGSYTAKDGQQADNTQWHRVVAWGRTAELCAEHLRKGSQVYVEGRIQTRQYDKDGQQLYVTEIVATTVQFVGSKAAEAAKPQRRRDREPGDDDRDLGWGPGAQETPF